MIQLTLNTLKHKVFMLTRTVPDLSVQALHQEANHSLSLESGTLPKELLKQIFDELGFFRLNMRETCKGYQVLFDANPTCTKYLIIVRCLKNGRKALEEWYADPTTPDQNYFGPSKRDYNSRLDDIFRLGAVFALCKSVDKAKETLNAIKAVGFKAYSAEMISKIVSSYDTEQASNILRADDKDFLKKEKALFSWVNPANEKEAQFYMLLSQIKTTVRYDSGRALECVRALDNDSSRLQALLSIHTYFSKHQLPSLLLSCDIDINKTRGRFAYQWYALFKDTNAAMIRLAKEIAKATKEKNELSITMAYQGAFSYYPYFPSEYVKRSFKDHSDPEQWVSLCLGMKKHYPDVVAEKLIAEESTANDKIDKFTRARDLQKVAWAVKHLMDEL
jgi:hypothetical protein